MGKSNDAPKPPDPTKVAGAQTANNIGTAIANANLGMVDERGPDGSVKYEPIHGGHVAYTDPNTGNVYNIPRFRKETTLSPSGQKLQDLGNQTKTNVATIGRDQSARIGDLLGRPVDLSNEATERRLMELGRSRLDPALDRRREQERNRLAQQGIRLGSTAYDRAMEGRDQAETDAYNQLLLTGRGQAVQETLTERNQPINEITALLSGSQVSMPNFTGTQMPQIPTVDRAGLEMGAHQQKMQAWQQEQAQRGGLMGGLFDLGGTIGAAGLQAGWFSDRRLKTDVERVGSVGELGVYDFRYLWDEPGVKRRGYMAQEVQRVKPEAVVPMGEWLGVDYTQLPEVF